MFYSETCHLLYSLPSKFQADSGWGVVGSAGFQLIPYRCGNHVFPVLLLLRSFGDHTLKNTLRRFFMVSLHAERFSLFCVTSLQPILYFVKCRCQFGVIPSEIKGKCQLFVTHPSEVSFHVRFPAKSSQATWKFGSIFPTPDGALSWQGDVFPFVWVGDKHLYLSVSQCLVGPAYALHFRVKYYSSEPNNLREEFTR